MNYIDIVFDREPGPEGPRFVEVEDAQGAGIMLGDWVRRGDGHWVLRFYPWKVVNTSTGYRPVTYDSECLRLARHYIAAHTGRAATDESEAAGLAQALQDTVGAWLVAHGRVSP
jgi:hypothetical protein